MFYVRVDFKKFTEELLRIVLNDTTLTTREVTQIYFRDIGVTSDNFTWSSIAPSATDDRVWLSLDSGYALRVRL